MIKIWNLSKKLIHKEY